MNFRFIKQVFFVLLLLPTVVFAHEARLETPFTPKSFGSRIGINGDGNSVVAWDRKQGGVVYVLENNKWELKTYLTPESSSAWRRIQSLSVSGSYAAFTSYPDKQIHVHRWNKDNKSWEFYKKFEHRFGSTVIIKVTPSGTILINDYGNGIIDIYNPHLNRFTKQITSPEENQKLSNFQVNGNLLIATSDTNTFVYKNYSLVAKLPSAWAFSSYGVNTIALRPKTSNEVHIYKYDEYINENGGWYKAETILPPSISNTIDSHGNSGTGIGFGTGASKIIGNKLYITDKVDLDGQYGMMSNTFNNNHSIIYEYNFIDGEWQYIRSIIPADFTYNYGTWNFQFSSQGDKLVLGDSTAHQVLNTNPHTSGAAYVFDLSDTTDLSLDISAPESNQTIGDIVSYQFKVTNNSENVASNITFENDYNPNTGLWDSKNDSDLRFVSAISSQGVCTNQSYDTNRVTCNIGYLSPGESVDITVEISPEFIYEINTFARVYADQFDNYYDDNFGLVSIYVSPENIRSYATPLEYDVTNNNPYKNNKGISTPTLSADGRFVSISSKSGLTERTGTYKNIFTVDRENTTIELSSTPASTFPSYHSANGDSYQSKISNDADLVVFSSKASNIVENDTNKQLDVFLHRRSTGETYRISVSDYGDEGNKASNKPDISADGKYVVFTSSADNLYSGDTNGDRDLFIHNVNNRRLSRIDLRQSGIDGLRIPNSPSISGNGTYISFTAKTSQGYSAYLWNRNTRKAKKISPEYNPDGTIATSPGKTEVSDNGNYVAYTLNGYIYRYNIQTEENELISVGINLETTKGSSSVPSISADGRYIVYKSFASNLVENDTNGFADIFVYDSINKTTRRVNKGVGGFQTKNHCSSPTISADGNTIAYVTKAHNLVFDDINQVDDIFFEGNPFTTEPDKEVDLSIEKTASASEIEIGKNITYTLTVDNISVDPEAIATDVSIEDVLPTGLTFDSVTPPEGVTCTENSGTILCDIGDIAVDDPSIDIEIVAKTTSKSEIKNTATVTAAETDSDTSNNSSEVSITVIELTDVYINGSIDDTVTYYIGGELTYSFEVGNNSSNPATDVTATIDIPTGISISSAVTDTGICSVTGQKVTCILGNISTTNANITVKATPSTAGDFDVAASVTTTKTDSDIDNNSDEVTITVEPKADLAISIADSDDPDDGSIYAGNDLTYTITVKNNGPSDATNVKIKDNLPTGVTFVSASSGCTEAAGEVICNIGDLANGASKSVNVVIKPTTPGTITNAVTVTATEFDPVAANDSAFEDTVVKAVADLEITSVSASPMPPSLVLTGNELTYTFKVKNNGINDATEVELKDILPNGVEFVSTGSSPDCTETAGEVTCSIGGLANGASIDIIIVVKPTKPGIFTNKATVSAKEYDPVDNNEKSIDVDVKAVTDMELVSASATPDPVYAGANLTYNVTIRNNAAEFNTATGIKVTYTFSDNIVLDSASSCTAIGKVVTCYASDMAHNTSKNMQLVIQPDMDGDLTADITVSSITHDPDTSENSNSKSVTTTVTPAVDLAISMEEDIDPVLVGQDLTYTITITNNGPSTATSVVLTDTLPGAAPVQSFVTSQGACINNLTTFDCNIGDLANDDSVEITLVLRPTNGATGTLINEATVSSGVYERPTTPDNNVASVSTTVNQSSKVKVSLKGKGSGNVEIDFNGTVTKCPDDCEKTFTRGDSVTLSATADAGSTFNGWQGGVCKGNSDTCTFTLDKPNMNVMASFK